MAFAYSGNLKLEIYGETFELDGYSSKLRGTMDNLAKEAMKTVSIKGENEEETALKKFEHLANISINFLQDVLGAEAVDKLTDGRELPAGEWYKMASYVCQEVNKFKAERMKYFYGAVQHPNSRTA